MTKKQVKITLVFFQLLLILTLFLPVGKIAAADASHSSVLSVFGMVRRYAGMGFSNDALVYMALSCCLPLLTILLLFLLHERKNFGVAACLCAFYTLAAACFFTAAKGKMVDSVAMTGLHYFIILLSLVSMGVAIFGYFIAMPPPGKNQP